MSIYKELVIVTQSLIGRGFVRAISIKILELPLGILIEVALSEVTKHLRSLIVELTIQRIGLTILRREVSTTDRSNAIVRT